MHFEIFYRFYLNPKGNIAEIFSATFKIEVKTESFNYSLYLLFQNAQRVY